MVNHLINSHDIEGRIYCIRNKRVMLDRDLAQLYGVSTKALKQAVRRNSDRFPQDFMFELTKDEFNNWRSQFVTSNSDKMGLRYAPLTFTENGVAMLSSVLRSKKAIQVNIQIMRVFTSIRQQALTQIEVLKKLEEIDKTLLNQKIINSRTEQQMKVIFEAIRHIIDPEPTEKRQFGFITDSQED